MKQKFEGNLLLSEHVSGPGNEGRSYGGIAMVRPARSSGVQETAQWAEH